MSFISVLMVPTAGLPPAADAPQSLSLGSGRRQAMERFLAEVEKRAFQLAKLSLRDEDDALDAVQEAMLKLCRHYADRPIDEWRPLFFRILVNQVQDLRRKRAVRGRWLAWWTAGRTEEEPDADFLETVPDTRQEPRRLVEGEQDLRRVAEAIERLPTRQQQAFLLRNLEGLDVAGTAVAMGCSEGSVKTHYFRALQALRLALAADGGSEP
jgi:RNA polymerase sigma-70 factor, ECF subfamily